MSRRAEPSHRVERVAWEGGVEHESLKIGAIAKRIQTGFDPEGGDVVQPS